MIKQMLLAIIILLTTIVMADSGVIVQEKAGQFYVAKDAPIPDWFKQSFLDIKDDLSEASADSRLVIIYFHQNNCPYCAKLINDNFHNTQLVAKLRKNFDIIDINMWGDRDITDWVGREFSEKEFAQFMHVQFTPSLLFLDAEAKIILRLNGYQSITKMHIALDYIISKAYKNTSFANYKNKITTYKKTKIALSQPEYFDSKPFILSRSKRFPATGKLTVIFTKQNCYECNKFYNDFLQHPDNERLLRQTQVVQLDIDDMTPLIIPNGSRITAAKWYEQLQLTDLPAMVFFDEVGKEVIRKDAYLKSFHFQSVLHFVVDNSYKTIPSFQRFIEYRSQNLRNKGFDVDIWQ